MTLHAKVFESPDIKPQRCLTAQGCLTDRDRTLLNIVTGWHTPQAAIIVPATAESGKEPLIPLLAWVIADARRHGRVQGELTPGAFEMAVVSLSRARNPALRLSSVQITNGRRFLTQHQARAGMLNADRAAAAAS